MAKKRVKKVSKKNKLKVTKSRIPLVIYQLLLFIGLSLIFLVLFRLSNTIFWLNFFQIMLIFSAFIAVGFLIALLVLWIMKIVKKK